MNYAPMIVSLTLALSACSDVIDPDDIPAGTPTGAVSVSLAATADTTDVLNPLVEEVWLRFEDVLVHSEEKGWITIGNDRRDIDLMGLRGGVPMRIGGADTYEGAYDAMRIIVADSWIVVAGDQLELTVARVVDLDGEGIDFSADFFVDEGVSTSVSLLWDLDEQLDEAGDDWTLRAEGALDVSLE